MKNLFTFIVALFMATGVYAQTETVKEWNFSNWTAGNLTENKTIDGLSVYATADKKMAIDGSNKTVDGVKYTQRFKFSGTGNVANESSLCRVISFEVTGPSDIYIVAAHGGKSTDASRPLVIASYTDNDFTSLAELDKITYNYGNPISSTVKYTGTKTAKILIYSGNSGINLYDIKVTPATLSDKVTITDAGFATHASKFAVDYSNRTDGLEAYAVKYADGKLTYNKIDGIVPANTAVLLKGEAKEYTLTVSGGAATTVDTDLKPSDGKTIGADNIYCLANKSKGVGFYRVETGVQIPANKAYLEIATPASTSAKYYSIGIGGNTTGIQAIQQNSVKADGIMYSLSGQRVGKDYKGIVICNGKKMIKK